MKLLICCRCVFLRTSNLGFSLITEILFQLKAYIKANKCVIWITLLACREILQRKIFNHSVYFLICWLQIYQCLSMSENLKRCYCVTLPASFVLNTRIRLYWPEWVSRNRFQPKLGRFRSFANNGTVLLRTKILRLITFVLFIVPQRLFNILRAFI